MNAYELAKKLEWYTNYDEFVEAGAMLRQQADRIKDLEKLLEHSVGADCREMRYIQEIENRDARIAELEKELYFKNYYEELPDTPVGIIGKIGDSPIHDLVHRTTPQIKELSDEEIQEISHDFGEIAWLGETTYNFARAILKKASEK